jgi:hypothetical protein
MHRDRSEIPQGYDETKQKEKVLGGRFRNSLRVNLDALSARNREVQIDAAMSAAEGYDFIHVGSGTEAKKRDKIIRDKYTVLTNPLQVLSQLDGIMHNAASVDIWLEEKAQEAKKQIGMDVEEKEKFKETPAYEIRRKAKEIYFDKDKLRDLYKADTLKSKIISDEDKAFMIDELPRLFKILEGQHPNPELANRDDQNGEAHREVVLQELITALPQISADLQQRLLGVITTIDYGRYGNRFLTDLAERRTFAEDRAKKWQRVDVEARLTFLEGLSTHDIENVARVNDLLTNEDDPKVKRALLQFLHKFSQVENVDVMFPRDKWNLVNYHRQESIRVLSSTKFDGSGSRLVGEAIFKLADSENMGDDFGLIRVFYDNDNDIETTKYDYSSMTALLSDLEGRLGRKTPIYERRSAIKIASKLFDAASRHLEKLLNSSRVDGTQLNEAVNILTRIRKKFAEPAKADTELRWLKFSMGGFVNYEIRQALNPRTGKSKIPRMQRGRLDRLTKQLS